VDLASLL
jgi:hypothetical protein